MSTKLIKTCSICNQTKSVNEFSPKQSMCRPCRAKHASEYRKQQKQAKTATIDLTQDSEEETHQNPVIDLTQDSDDESQTNEPKTTAVYLLTSPEMEHFNRYKVGKHTGEKSKLVKRYKTYLVDVNILRFATLPGDFSQHEKALHAILEEWRYENSEWFVLDKEKVLDIFDEYVRSTNMQYIQNALKDLQMYNHMLNVTHDMLVQSNPDLSDNLVILDTLKNKAQQSLDLANNNLPAYLS